MAFGLIIAWHWLVALQAAMAVVATTGNVTPVPPAGGGNVAAPFLVGDSSFGRVTIDGGTPINVTGGSAIVGDDATGIGVVTLTGLGSNLTTTGTADLTIGNNGAGNVSVAGLAQILIGDDLFVAANVGSSGRLTISDFGTIVDINDAQVGQLGDGVIELTGGARMFADDTVIAQTAAGDGRLTISGPQTLWRQPNSMTVADAGHGTLELLNQARLETLNVVVGNTVTSNGRVEVSGAGSEWQVNGFMILGALGNSTVQVRGGGVLRNTSSARLATMSDGESHVEVNGAQSLWAVGTTLTVGEVGFGTMQILNGGRVTSGNAKISDSSASRGEVTVDGQGSTWEIDGSLDVSDFGEAKLTISNGGLVTTDNAARVNPVGTLALAGGRLATGSEGLTNQGLVRGGGTISGFVTNTPSGEIRVQQGDQLVLNNNLTNAGLIDLNGGEMEVLGVAVNLLDIDVRNGTLRFQSGLNNNSGGQLAIVGGEVDVFGAFTNAIGAQVVVGGDAHAAFHDSFTNNGNLLVTAGAELLTLEIFSFGGGSSLLVQLQENDPTEAGTIPSDAFSQVHVASSASLAGTLEVELLGGYMPMAGDSFQIITAGGGRSGFFANEILPSLAGGLDWDVRYNPNSVVLNVISAGLVGDYNNDGAVDAADYVAWRKANINGPAGYDDFRMNFGESVSGGSDSPLAVPEPTSFTLIAIGLIFAGVSRPHRHSAASAAAPTAPARTHT